MKQYFAIINGKSICSHDKNAVISALGEEDFVICSEVPGNWQGIRIKKKGSVGESFSTSSHLEFYRKLGEQT
ncbi:MAG: hypothetical protein ACFFG0_08280 [Candidatus Thorarchaeota archaeon]